MNNLELGNEVVESTPEKEIIIDNIMDDMDNFFEEPVKIEKKESSHHSKNSI